MKTVLVTGGAGYIGSTLVKILLEKGYKVKVVDYLAFGGEALIGMLGNPNFTFTKGDIRDLKLMEKILEGVDYVCHLAAIVGDPACKKFAEDAQSINWDASVSLYELCEKKNIKKFVFASTCSNYGKMADSSGFLTEDSDLRPVSLYAELKVKFEKFLLERSRTPNISSTVLRFSTVYGLSTRMRFDLTVNEFTRDIALNKELVIFGEQFWRPYCHVYDLANSCLYVLEAPEEIVKGEVFNVGNTNENYTKGMIVDELKKIDKNMEVKYVKQVDDPRDYRVDFSKIKEKLHYKTTKTVPDGISEIYDTVNAGFFSDLSSKKYSNI